MSNVIKVPAFDKALIDAFAALPEAPLLSDDTLAIFRQGTNAGPAQIAADLEKFDVVAEERLIEGPRGQIPIVIISPQGGVASAPAIYHIHGGGMVMGDMYMGLSMYHLVERVARYGLVLVSVDYRMAPEFPGLAAVEDCVAGLVWTAEHADSLGIDPARIILAGASGGGGLAAGAALLNRDNGGPNLLAQVLWCPQLDDRSDYPSAQQFSHAAGNGYFWPRENHQYAWDTILGKGHEAREDVSVYAAANRATDLRGLPPAFIDAGANEVFRDTAVQYATKLWASGVSAELHVWAGAFHGFDASFPDVPVAAAAQSVHESWFRRILSLDHPADTP